MLHDHAVGVMKEHGAVVTPVNLHELNLPVYDPSLEESAFPANAQELKNKLMAAGKQQRKK